METKCKNCGIKTPYADLEQFCQNYDHQGEYFSNFVRFNSGSYSIKGLKI